MSPAIHITSRDLVRKLTSARSGCQSGPGTDAWAVVALGRVGSCAGTRGRDHTAECRGGGASLPCHCFALPNRFQPSWLVMRQPLAT